MDIEKISKYLLTTVLKLLKGVPDLWRADVSRIIKELKEMAELESHAGERQRSVIRAHREFLINDKPTKPTLKPILVGQACRPPQILINDNPTQSPRSSAR